MADSRIWRREVVCPSCQRTNMLTALGLLGMEVVHCSCCHAPLGTWSEISPPPSRIQPLPEA